MATNNIDTEFGKIINQIKLLYMSLNNSSEKNIVGNLIRELIQLSNTEFQKGQRNELAKALLYKLKSNQFSTARPTHISEGDTKFKQAKSTCNQNLSRPRKRSSERKHLTRNSLKKIRKIRIYSRSASARRGFAKHSRFLCSKPIHPQSHKMKGQPSILSSSGSTVAELDESTTDKSNLSTTTTDTESECATLSNRESGSESNTCQQHSPLNRLVDLLYEQLSNQRHQQKSNNSNDFIPNSKNVRNKYQKCQQNSNSKTKTSVVSKPVVSRAQISEADFYDQLVEVRRENEIEIAKLMNRKNAELAEVQQEAEKKHAELKLSIDKLEEQLAVAVANADKVRRQSEEQTNQLQVAMTKQLDNLYEQSAQQKEELIREHKQEIDKQREVHQKALERLSVQEELNKELQKSMEEERQRCQHLQRKLQEIKLQLHKAHEQQTALQGSAQHMEREIKRWQLNLEEQSETRLREAVAQREEEFLRLKTEHQAQISCIKREHESTVTVLQSTIRCIQDELKKKVGAENKHNAEVLLAEISAAYERGRIQGEKESNLRTEALQVKLKEVNEKYQLTKDNFQLRFEKIRDQIEQIKTTFNEKQLELQAEEYRIQQKQEKLEAVLNVVCNNEETQTDQLECACVALRVSEVVAKEMAYWQGKSLEESVISAKKEEQLRLEALFHEKEEHINRQHMRELDQLKTEHANRLNEWRRRAELAQAKVKQFEVELGEAKRLLTKEVETRRQQLSEISQAREFERKEWERQHEEQLKRIERDQEEQIRQLRIQFIEELQTTTNRKLFEIENEYKSQLVQMSENLHESQMQIDRLKQKLQKTLDAHDQMKQATETAHQQQLEEMRASHQQMILSIKSSASKDRARARTAEALLRQHEKLWNVQMKHWTTDSTENLLPAEVQRHLESTIESLRLQVDFLQKRIALLEGEQEPCVSSCEPSRYTCLPTKEEAHLHGTVKEHPTDRDDSRSVKPVHATGNIPIQIDLAAQHQKTVTGKVLNHLSSLQQICTDLPCSEKPPLKCYEKNTASSESILHMVNSEMEA